MQKSRFNRQTTGLFTDQQNQLAYKQDDLLPFIGHTFSKENFKKQIQEKGRSYSAKQREALCLALKDKYSQVEQSAKVKNNIEILNRDNSFTVTTGHQLSIFTGPIYLIYKIIHVIRLTEELKKEYPENNFVPVYWMASEDHDFEEIQSVEVFNKKLTWETEQKGPVGRFDTAGLEKVKVEILSFFKNQPESEIEQWLASYSGKNLSDATFKMIHYLFNEYGLLIVDGDNQGLKRNFIPVIEKELKEQFSYHAVTKTNESISKEGLKIQVNAREINLFYIGDNFRERIIADEEGFYIEGKRRFTLDEIIGELHEFPERFSPNVILRPVFQEVIMPNLCYVGGVGEISYWLQLKGVFDAIELPFPMIQARTSILWIDSALSKKLNKANIALEDLFLDVSQIKNQYLKEFAADEVDFSALNSKFEEFKMVLKERINNVDNNLNQYGQAEIVRMEKQIDGIKDKLVKTVKQRHDNAMKTIDQVFEKLFPNGGMQERSLNIISLCNDGKIKEKINNLYTAIDPFNPDFLIIQE
jgi:bacillithiol biosynthesis cysteine-adding enzyme BshC